MTFVELLSISQVCGLEVYHETTGWTTRIARRVTIAKVCSLRGGESTIAEYAVSHQNWLPLLAVIEVHLSRSDFLFAMCI